MTTTPLPPLPEVGYLGDDASYGYDANDMTEYATQARADLEAAIERKDALLRQALGALDLYKAYGWPDRNGVIPAIKQELSQ